MNKYIKKISIVLALSVFVLCSKQAFAANMSLVISNVTASSMTVSIKNTATAGTYTTADIDVIGHLKLSLDARGDIQTYGEERFNPGETKVWNIKGLKSGTKYYLNFEAKQDGQSVGSKYSYVQQTISLPACIANLSSRVSTNDPNVYQATFATEGVVQLYMSEKRFVQLSGNQRRGTWSCADDRHVTLVFDSGNGVVQNPFTINVTKTSNSATINVTSSKKPIAGSSKGIEGTIQVNKKNSTTPIKSCTAIFNSSGTTTACVVSGLVANQTYVVNVTANDYTFDANDPMTYVGSTEFKLNGTASADPATPPAPTDPQDPPVPPGPQEDPPVPPGPSSTAGGGSADDGSAATSTFNNVGNKVFNLGVVINNPLKVDTIQGAIKLFMDAVLKIAIPFIVIFFIWSGLSFVLARGNPEKIKTAKNMFLYTIIGTLLILGAWTITNIIIGTVNSVTG